MPMLVIPGLLTKSEQQHTERREGNMAGRAKLPSLEVVLDLKKQGLSNEEIGKKYGVGKEAVRIFLVRHGVKTPRIRYDHSRYKPWRVRQTHAHAPAAHRLLDYSKHCQGGELPPSRVELLQEWMKFMDGDNPHGVPLSVAYSLNEGFWVQPRQPGDRDYIHPPVGK